MLKKYAAALGDEDGTYFFSNTLLSSNGSTDVYNVFIKTYNGATVDVKVTALVKVGVGGHLKIDGNTKVLNDVVTFTATSDYINFQLEIKAGNTVGDTTSATILISRVVSTINNKITFPKQLSYTKTRV